MAGYCTVLLVQSTSGLYQSICYVHQHCGKYTSHFLLLSVQPPIDALHLQSMLDIHYTFLIALLIVTKAEVKREKNGFYSDAAPSKRSVTIVL